MKHSRGNRFLMFLLTAALILGMGAPASGIQAQAASGKIMSLDMAKKNGLANSTEYEKLESELNVKEVSLKQAIKSIKLKKKNMSTFRWTPLLSFKFPEKPNLTEAYEFEFKPIQIQSEIDTIRHKMTDQILAVYENVSTLYVDIVMAQENIAFYEERVEAATETLSKNRIRLKLGKASKGDIDALEKSIDAMNQKLVSEKRNLEAAKKKLSKLIGIDVTSGYTFKNPFVESFLTRSQLKELTQYTMDRDQTYYEACMNETTNLTSLRTNYRLMEEQYGGKMEYISGFVNQAISGQKLNTKAFKQKYEEFLTAIDKPWQGKIRILFIKIPKEWFKGQISGIRYVEDEPYALYEAALAYQDALLEKNNARDSLIQQVEDSYNNVVNMRSAYISLVKQVEASEQSLKKEEILNRLGELTFEEYSSSLETYEDQQTEMLDALAQYSKSLYSFDRLTCGGVTALLSGTDADLNAGTGGQSYIEEEYADGAYYYIETIVQQQEFRLGVSIPEDFDVEVTDFELWCDKTRIGERTPVDKTIRHLMLSVDGISQVKLRFYNSGTFVDDCVIDPAEYSGPLKIIKGYHTVEAEDLTAGTYTYKTNNITGMVTITLKPEGDEKIGFYRILSSDGKPLNQDAPIPIDTDFRYLGLLVNSMKDLVIEFYGEDSTLLYKGYFDTGNMKMMKNPKEG